MACCRLGMLRKYGINQITQNFYVASRQVSEFSIPFRCLVIESRTGRRARPRGIFSPAWWTGRAYRGQTRHSASKVPNMPQSACQFRLKPRFWALLHRHHRLTMKLDFWSIMHVIMHVSQACTSICKLYKSAQLQ